jgi:hypothetical protein
MDRSRAERSESRALSPSDSYRIMANGHGLILCFFFFFLLLCTSSLPIDSKSTAISAQHSTVTTEGREICNVAVVIAPIYGGRWSVDADGNAVLPEAKTCALYVVAVSVDAFWLREEVSRDGQGRKKEETRTKEEE